MKQRSRSTRVIQGLRPLLLWTGTVVGAGACAAGAKAPGAPEAAEMATPAAAEPPMGGQPGVMPEGFPAPPMMAMVAEEPPAAQPMAEEDQKAAKMKVAPQWAPVRQFPVPNYSAEYDGPRVDFRETVYWSPSVRTDASGKAEVKFYLSDAVTSFRATAQGVSSGGDAGRGEALLPSKLPVSLAAKLPLEVTRGDSVELPVTLTNTTAKARAADVKAAFGGAFSVKEPAAQKVRLAPKAKKTLYYTLDVKDASAGSKVDLAVAAGAFSDSLSRTVRVVPPGFPHEVAKSGTLESRARKEFEITGALAGTIEGRLSFYPSPSASLVAGAEAMLQEPGGCFEQASSSNYPNIMVLSFLKVAGKTDEALMARTEGMLDRGYKLIAGYETPTKGYEWFGGDPGHEALTAYGLMEFADMAKVYRDVDPQMVERTRAWLRGRRDGKGGYRRNSRALDSFGAASEAVTNAYITFALTEAGERDLAPEIARAKRLAASEKDPYVLALVANTLLNVDKGGAEARAAVDRLGKMQQADGHYGGADHSITRSGGIALDIETTALATMAMMKADGRGGAVQKAVQWITTQGSGGMYGSTQSTILALKVLSKSSGAPPAGTVAIDVNGKRREVRFDPGQLGTALSYEIGRDLREGKNTVEIVASQALKLPFGVTVTYRTDKPASSPQSPVRLSAALSSAKVRAGAPVKMRVTIANGKTTGIPMVVAVLGIPGGTTFQTWQLDELKKKKAIDYYETRERQVIVYLRSMGPRARRSFNVDLLATVPGTYAAPASSAYLYYTDEHKTWIEPLTLRVTR